MAGLTIPSKSLAEFERRVKAGSFSDDNPAMVVAQLAAPVAAAELRRQADEWSSCSWTREASTSVVTSGLRSRADELDPPAGGDS